MSRERGQAAAQGDLVSEELGKAPPIDEERREVVAYLAKKFLPNLEREEAATKGRGGGRFALAGPLVQVCVERHGMSKIDARKHVQSHFAAQGRVLKRESIAAAHRQFLRNGQPSTEESKPARRLRRKADPV